MFYMVISCIYRLWPFVCVFEPFFHDEWGFNLSHRTTKENASYPVMGAVALWFVCIYLVDVRAIDEEEWQQPGLYLKVHRPMRAVATDHIISTEFIFCFTTYKSIYAECLSRIFVQLYAYKFIHMQNKLTMSIQSWI